MIRDLIDHKGYANAAILGAIRANTSAAADAELRDLLHHVLLANRFWLLTLTGQPFDAAAESRASTGFEELVERFRAVQEQEAAWLAAATEADLPRVVESASIPGGRCSVAQALMQVCLHSLGHRAQCAKLLRRHGAVPPMTDFILWLSNRPSPAWV